MRPWHIACIESGGVIPCAKHGDAPYSVKDPRHDHPSSLGVDGRFPGDVHAPRLRAGGDGVVPGEERRPHDEHEPHGLRPGVPGVLGLWLRLGLGQLRPRPGRRRPLRRAGRGDDRAGCRPGHRDRAGPGLNSRGQSHFRADAPRLRPKIGTVPRRLPLRPAGTEGILPVGHRQQQPLDALLLHGGGDERFRHDPHRDPERTLGMAELLPLRPLVRAPLLRLCQLGLGRRMAGPDGRQLASGPRRGGFRRLGRGARLRRRGGLRRRRRHGAAAGQISARPPATAARPPRGHDRGRHAGLGRGMVRPERRSCPLGRQRGAEPGGGQHRAGQRGRGRGRHAHALCQAHEARPHDDVQRPAGRAGGRQRARAGWSRAGWPS